MHKSMQNIPMHVWIVSWGHKKSFLCACKSLYFFIYFVILRKSMKNPEKIKNIYRYLYYIPNIMLYEPFILKEYSAPK